MIKIWVREYIPLQIVHEDSFPDMVPISYEFRFFYFEGKCMGYGPYWSMGGHYRISESELLEVLKLTKWAANRIGACFPAIDVAKTASGEWNRIKAKHLQEQACREIPGVIYREGKCYISDVIFPAVTDMPRWAERRCVSGLTLLPFLQGILAEGMSNPWMKRMRRSCVCS